jgi:hypothetical protein
MVDRTVTAAGVLRWHWKGKGGEEDNRDEDTRLWHSRGAADTSQAPGSGLGSRLGLACVR